MTLFQTGIYGLNYVRTVFRMNTVEKCLVGPGELSTRETKHRFYRIRPRQGACHDIPIPATSIRCTESKFVMAFFSFQFFFGSHTLGGRSLFRYIIILSSLFKGKYSPQRPVKKWMARRFGSDGRGEHPVTPLVEYILFKDNTLFFRPKYMINRIEQNSIVHMIGLNKRK
jgi:hypothetical protein